MKTWIALLSALLLTLSCAAAESPEAGHTAMLSLNANPSTGYSWAGAVLGGDAVQLDSAEGTYIPDAQTAAMTGAPSIAAQRYISAAAYTAASAASMPSVALGPGRAVISARSGSASAARSFPFFMPSPP